MRCHHRHLLHSRHYDRLLKLQSVEQKQNHHRSIFTSTLVFLANEIRILTRYNKKNQMNISSDIVMLY